MAIYVKEVGEMGRRYAHQGLAQGLTIARSASAATAEFPAVGLIADDKDIEQALDFSRGGIGQVDLRDLSVVLKTVFDRS
ncbi:hypothetical protein [Amycolatopsis sp. GM8]|uniref:hypothetical protein n=1 Tax=Amycolatopsis sp. GM8 TaxID=2896530 RepID=UPI001F198226|nr:hypothetical protein [Amycolatopsis sp. GM8]